MPKLNFIDLRFWESVPECSCGVSCGMKCFYKIRLITVDLIPNLIKKMIMIFI